MFNPITERGKGDTVSTGHLVVEAAAERAVEPSIDELIGRYQERLLNFSVRMTGNWEDAEEVVQDTFAKADRALRLATPDRPIDPAPAWFYTIALNTIRNRVRRRRLPTVGLDGSAGVFDVPAADRERPEAVAARGETIRQLECALIRLPAHQRAPVLLRFVEDLSYEEIASILQCPLGTAKSHVHRGIRRLRQELESFGGKEWIR